jgi:hypothetical protein
MRWALASVRGIPLLIPCNDSAAELGSGSHAQRQAVFYKFAGSQKSHYAERRSFGSEDVQMRCGVYGQCHSNEVRKMRREESKTEMKAEAARAVANRVTVELVRASRSQTQVDLT